jgi:hypothetical protein
MSIVSDNQKFLKEHFSKRELSKHKDEHKKQNLLQLCRNDNGVLPGALKLNADGKEKLRTKIQKKS